ncbi:hypothetical protein GCM10009844_24030 [Nocardioides koreensis]|uniref:Uncharacterized protein n=1 Tax=Nocardioides koreensis TaxID=433651 RepID=A0ABP5LK14_9ACTN
MRLSVRRGALSGARLQHRCGGGCALAPQRSSHSSSTSGASNGDTLWRTPHGLWRLVHPDGTSAIDERAAAECFGDDELTPALARLWWEHRKVAA